MKFRAYFVHHSIRNHWALRSMSRCPDQVISLKRDPPLFKSPSEFGAHLSTHCSRVERPSRPCPARGKNPNL
ncbi:hypothetical protein TNCV_813791, partial [Trichonephila clavipes]